MDDCCILTTKIPEIAYANWTTPFRRFSFMRNGADRKQLQHSGRGVMTIIKPMKNGTLVAQGRTLLGQMLNQKSPPLACAAADSRKTNRFVMDHIARRDSVRTITMQRFAIRQFSTQARLKAKVSRCPTRPSCVVILPNANVCTNKFSIQAKSRGFNPKTEALRGSFQ